MSAVYLDHNASSPLRPAALEAMLPWLQGVTANPSSTHRDGCRARAALDEARATLADLLGVNAQELLFTSGGTESNNLALKGSWITGELITLASEHPSVLGPARKLVGPGRTLVELLPERNGLLDPGRIQEALADRTRLVSIQAVNHETGAIQPIEQIGRLLAQHPALFHVDAVQALGRLPLPVDQWRIDLLSCSSHKIGGPVGIGALYVRTGTTLLPQQLGGAQEHGLRAGTESVALATGFAAAAVEAVAQRQLKQGGKLPVDALEGFASARFAAGSTRSAVDTGLFRSRLCKRKLAAFHGARGHAVAGRSARLNPADFHGTQHRTNRSRKAPVCSGHRRSERSSLAAHDYLSFSKTPQTSARASVGTSALCRASLAHSLGVDRNSTVPLHSRPRSVNAGWQILQLSSNY